MAPREALYGFMCLSLPFWVCTLLHVPFTLQYYICLYMASFASALFQASYRSLWLKRYFFVSLNFYDFACFHLAGFLWFVMLPLVMDVFCMASQAFTSSGPACIASLYQFFFYLLSFAQSGVTRKASREATSQGFRGGDVELHAESYGFTWGEVALWGVMWSLPAGRLCCLRSHVALYYLCISSVTYP